MPSGVGTLVSALLLASVIAPGPAFAFQSYQAVKQTLYDQVFASTGETMYCGCSFDKKRKLDLDACGYLSPGGGERSRRVEVEHVVPASSIGRGRACWDRKICRDNKGRLFKGRKCCLQIDPAFLEAYQDLHNLWPVVGEVNEQRRNYAFGLVDGEPRAFGRCDFEIDRGKHLVEPAADIRGDIARINLYMAERHQIPLSARQHHLFEIWHRADPPDAAERQRNRIIEKIQGEKNEYISG